MLIETLKTLLYAHFSSIFLTVEGRGAYSILLEKVVGGGGHL